MTVRKHFKQLVRARMSKTGESYTTARRHVIRIAPPKPADPAARWHFPGNLPATTALRVLLAAAGVKAPHTREPFSEAMLFGIAGGVGLGVAAFRYEAEDCSCFFIAGRHLWYDDLAYIKAALGRFGIRPIVKETTGAKGAEKQLREALEAGPCVAWVDLAHLPHRAAPAVWEGGGYHLITVYKVEAGHALIGDLTDEPITISLSDLAAARGRIKKQAHRLLSVPASDSPTDLAALIKDGLSACHKSLSITSGRGALAMSTFEALRRWADRLHASKDKQAWEKAFPPGINLWRGLTSIHQFVEHYGTGGGLCRPIFAEFLDEAADALKDVRLRALSAQYAELGRGWSALADAALPDAVPAFREAKELYSRYAELFTAGGTVGEKRAVWARLDELAAAVKERFPLSDAECAGLRAGLQERARALIAGEESALKQLATML